MKISEKINSWRFGILCYFIFQSMVLIAIFKICTTKEVSQTDLVLKGQIAEYIFNGTALYQYVFIIPACLFFLLLKFKRAALALFICSILWLVVIVSVIGNQQ